MTHVQHIASLETAILLALPNRCCAPTDSGCPWDRHDSSVVADAVRQWIAGLPGEMIARAYLEPGRYIKREPGEVMAEWGARAVLAALASEAAA